MAYTNFKQTFWSKHIQSQLEKHCVLLEDCDFTYEGEVKHGEKIKVLGVGRPTISEYNSTDIGVAETVTDSAVELNIDQAKYFNFMVDDVDKAQGTPGLMEALTLESSRALAQERDTYIASLYTQAGETSSSVAVSTPEDAKKAVDAAFEVLWNNGVKIGSDVTVVLTPWFYNLFKDELTNRYTDNMELISQGIIGLYNGAAVKLSNNLYNDETDDYMFVKTKRAIAFAGQIQSTEAYRPEGLFADALKGLDVYGAKVVKPDEMYVIKAHKA
ncbi:MAG: hypothetical protein E7218_05115 [Anaerofustis stercorihominis]|nr:hypothetical protein [Anaerofustis stercorihominis]